MPAALDAGPELCIEDLEVVLSGETVLHDVNLCFRGPGLVLILGPNGAGKTTLFRTIMGLIKPSHGRIVVNGVDVTGEPELAGKYVGYMPQMPPPLDYPVTTIEALTWHLAIAFEKWPRLGRSARHRAEAERLLERVGLGPNVWDIPLRDLSGGQRQRFMLARALAGGKPILLLDEPLSAVDPRGRRELADLIGGLGRDHLILVTSHDPTLFVDYAKTVVLLNRRVVAWGRARDVLRVDVVARVYGGAAVEVAPGHVHIADSHIPG